MKKILLASTAIAAISVASAASAQESNMMSAAGNEIIIGGFYQFGWNFFGDDKKAVNEDTSRTYGDSELYIDFENTTDNGLTYGVQIDLEVTGFNEHQDGAETVNTDEASIYLRSEWGELNLGHDDNAFGRFLTWAPTHGGTTSQDDTASYLGRGDNLSITRLGTTGGTELTGGDTIVSPVATTAAGGGSGWAGGAAQSAFDDDAKVTYVSPNFGGFQFGISTEDDDDSAGNHAAIGLSYDTEIRGVALALTGANYDNNKSGDAGNSENQIGITLGYGDTVVSLARYSGKSNAGFKRSAVELGVGYSINENLSVGISRANGEATGIDKIPGINATDANGDYTHAQNPGVLLDATTKDSGAFTSVSGSYTIAPGLNTTLAVNQFQVERKGAGAAKNSGREIVWEVGFSF